jgi:putative copper export protein
MRVLTTRFGYLAWAALAVLVITGIANLYERDEALEFLFDRNFGIIFQVKMTLLILVVALTALHSFVIGPRIMRMQESVADESQIASMRRWSMIVSGVSLLMALAIVFCGSLLDSKFALE